MAQFRKVTPVEFDSAVKASCVEDEHEFLESRFLDRNKNVIAKVVRYLDEDGELKPEADLFVADQKRGQVHFSLESEPDPFFSRPP